MRKGRSVKILCAMLLIAVCSVGVTNAREHKGTGQGCFYIGASTVDVEKLNTSLRAFGYPELSDRVMSMGGGGHAFINRLVIGGQGHALISKSYDVIVRNVPYKTELTAGIGFFNVGYLLTPQSSLKVYPMFGIGGGGIELSITEKQPPAFEQILQQPNRSTHLSKAVLLVNVALGVDYFIVTQRDEEGVGGLVLGFELGYNLCPVTSGWSAEEIEITGGPDVGIAGPYVRFKIGGGGKRK
ncbi:MAG: hypothetical protein ONB14_00775 [candidate division KSB1 bacterium]|nr:hypothetical protein [candidate division KSB1 bacterium]